MTPFFDRRFVVMCGKGGVGRSTLCASVAVEAARRGKRVLVCELNTKERIPSLLGGRPGGPVITHAWSAESGPGGVWCVNIVPEHAMREYGLMKLRVRALYRVAFENRLVRGFLRLVPGLPELLMLGKAFFHESEQDTLSGRPRWDMVVVDAPATGHGVSLLRIPQVVLAITSRGPMADDARRMQGLLTDPAKTSLNIVTLPEAMPVSEAIDLRRQLEEILHLPTGYVFLNAVRRRGDSAAATGAGDAPPGASDSARVAAELATLSGQRTGDDPIDETLRAMSDAVGRRARRTAAEQEQITALLDNVRMPVVTLPFVAAERWGFDAISRLGDEVAKGIAQLEGGP